MSAFGWFRSRRWTDILTSKALVQPTLNLVKATLDALSQLRTREQVERLRGVSLT
ncbi:MAG: hypothetical protein R3C49_12625 [Planctomycetaceae bacterium]